MQAGRGSDRLELDLIADRDAEAQRRRGEEDGRELGESWARAGKDVGTCG